MVAAETAEFEAFDACTDFEADLDTEADQHLRRSRRATQGQILCGSGASPGLDGAKPRHHTIRGTSAYCCSTSFSRAALPLSPRR